MITGRIDLNKLDKAKVFEGRNGAQYIDVALIETPHSKYDQDYMIVQSVSKEERQAGKRGPILGNAKIMGDRGKPAHPTPATRKEDDDSVPF
jgi:hypothetical protein